MALPRTTPDTWFGSWNVPTRQFETSGNDYELYEEDDEFVLSVEMPGFDPEEISVTWDDGILNVAAEQESGRRGSRTYHRRFRFPKRVVDEDITAEYTNGILDIRLPIETGAVVSGQEIDIE